MLNKSSKESKILIDLRRSIYQDDDRVAEACSDDATSVVHRQAFVESEQDSTGLPVAKHCSTRVGRCVRTHVEVAMSVASSVLVQGWVVSNVSETSLYFAESDDVERILKETTTVARPDEAADGVDVEAADVQLVLLAEEGGLCSTLTEHEGGRVCRLALVKCREFQQGIRLGSLLAFASLRRSGFSKGAWHEQSSH